MEMWRKKKIIILVTVLAVVLVTGSIGGVALAQTGSTGTGATGNTLIARVASILGIDQQKVEDAFTKAQKEMREEALDTYLKDQVAKGKMTQEQADQYKKWLESKPDMEQYRQQLREWQQTKPGIPEEFKNWQGEKPDVPFPGLGGRFGTPGFKGGRMGGMGRCFPGS